jgi:hypothetical protein
MNILSSDALNIQSSSKKNVGLANSLFFCDIALVPLSAKENNIWFQKIEFILVILSIIDFQKVIYFPGLGRVGWFDLKFKLTQPSWSWKWG